MKAIAFLPIFLLFLAGDPTTALTSRTVLQWDAPVGSPAGGWLDTAGNPDTITRAELGVFPIAAPPDLAGVAPLATFPLASHDGVAGVSVPPGAVAMQEGMYKVAVRVCDDALNWSAWSTPIVAKVDKTGPKAPGSLRLQITITVEGE